ncbi:hypothetical protein D3C76_1044060 [compost metagenome]
MWTKHFHQLRKVGVGVRQADHIIDGIEPERLQLRRDRLGVVDDMMGTQFLDPRLGLRP